MADFTNAVVTNAGAAAEATANANGWTIAFTRVQVGSGTGASDSTTLKALTALRTPVTLVSPDPSAPNANLIGINNLVTYQVSVRFEVNSAWVTTQFQLSEAGLFAKLNNGTEFLYAYAYAGATGDIITNSGSGSPVDNQYTFVIPYSNAPTISVTLGVYPTVNLHASTHLDNGTDPIPLPSTTRSGSCPANNNNALQVLVGSNSPAFGAVPAHETQHLDNGSDPLPYPSTTRSGVVLKNPNDGTQVLTGSNPPTWQYGILAIRSNVILYVSTTGNDSTAVVNDVAHPWLTIAAALSYLNPYFIVPGVTATISIGPGTFTLSSSVTVNHPQASQIFFSGTRYSTTTLSNIGATGGSSGDFRVPFTVGSTANISIGTWLFLEGLTSLVNGTQSYFTGCFKVTAISGNLVTVSIPIGGTPFNVSGITAGTVTPIGTIINAPATDACFTTPYGCGGISNMVMIGQSTSGPGIFCNGPGITNATYCAFTGFSNAGFTPFNDGRIGAISLQNGGCGTLANCFFVSGYFGVRSTQGGSANVSNSSALSNNWGFDADAGMMTLNGCFASFSVTSGIVAARNGSILATACISDSNAYGFETNSQGNIVMGSTPVAFGNTSSDYHVSTGGIIFSNSSYQGNTFFPGRNVLSSDGSAIWG